MIGSEGGIGLMSNPQPEGLGLFRQGVLPFNSHLVKAIYMVVNLGPTSKHLFVLDYRRSCEQLIILYKSTIFPTASPTQYYSAQLYAQQWNEKR